MILDSDTQIITQVEDISKLYETFVNQRKLRCDLYTKYWRFEFLLMYKYKTCPEDQPEENYVYVNNLHNPDDVSEEFYTALDNIRSYFPSFDIIPLHL